MKSAEISQPDILKYNYISEPFWQSRLAVQGMMWLAGLAFLMWGAVPHPQPAKMPEPTRISD